MSPARTVKSSRMPHVNSDQRKAHAKMIGDLYRVYCLVRKGNLRVVNPNPKQPFIPRMEIYDNPASDTIVATFELPGVKFTDISISVKDEVLFVEGERRNKYIRHRHPSVREPARTEGGNMDVDSDMIKDLFPHSEFRYGKFRKTFDLPRGADNSCIKASTSDGLLTVIWPRDPLAYKQTHNMERLSLEHPTSALRGRHSEPLATSAHYYQDSM
ncbi:HSP20-like chaperone [Mycena sanguinolenta]|nr:HSP20-like chaperone [Mycena sanguinolenta]